MGTFNRNLTLYEGVFLISAGATCMMIGFWSAVWFFSSFPNKTEFELVKSRLLAIEQKICAWIYADTIAIAFKENQCHG